MLEGNTLNTEPKAKKKKKPAKQTVRSRNARCGAALKRSGGEWVRAR